MSISTAPPAPPSAPSTVTTSPRSRLAAVTALHVLFWASVAMSVMLFVLWGGIATMVDLGSTMRGLGMITGLIGTDLVLVMLVLAARIPWLDQLIGHDTAIAYHRKLGKPALYLILAHAALLIGGAAVLDGFDVVGATITILTDLDNFLASIGLLLFVVIVVSSIVAAVRKWSYEAWYVIHLLSYIAIVLALPHQSIPGAVLADGSWRYAYWLTLYGIAFGSLLLFRVLLPVGRSLFHGLKVSRVEYIAPGVASIYLTGRRVESLRIRGGQYALWRFWGAKTWWHAHPISFSATPTPNTLRITVRELGDGSRALTNVNPGTRVTFSGPFGIFTNQARTAPHAVLISAGIGVTPIRAFLEDAALSPGEATVILRHSGSDPTYLWDEIHALAEESGTRVIEMRGHRPPGITTWMSATASAEQLTLESMLPELTDSDLYVCGPTAWTELVIQDARAAGVPEHQIHVEQFDW